MEDTKLNNTTLPSWSSQFYGEMFITLSEVEIKMRIWAQGTCKAEQRRINKGLLEEQHCKLTHKGQGLRWTGRQVFCVKQPWGWSRGMEANNSLLRRRNHRYLIKRKRNGKSWGENEKGSRASYTGPQFVCATLLFRVSGSKFSSFSSIYWGDIGQ